MCLHSLITYAYNFFVKSDGKGKKSRYFYKCFSFPVGPQAGGIAGRSGRM